MTFRVSTFSKKPQETPARTCTENTQNEPEKRTSQWFSRCCSQRWPCVLCPGDAVALVKFVPLTLRTTEVFLFYGVSGALACHQLSISSYWLPSCRLIQVSCSSRKLAFGLQQVGLVSISRSNSRSFRMSFSGETYLNGLVKIPLCPCIFLG